ncbi:type II toxin-antitoxin system PemK/MazF family toxin [Patescibacteria group bacterium]|nr:type II toxin-antitoxin system PemK/MazF family toxin [Patescibacteria group bacterium]MBU1015630.1 type II toxin-antitoxin system PemK/MazF family toxin [Patescibacteria group bacterium]MBU1684993.1 type II toxin-antitoxin system PemK/MazF family toxin [Patescibacteria group bacterium]MBU1938535.1 type II toxin-antitoxin system PemK/MazF family toxin [Patescibacteria group bacterium]
MSRNKRFDNWNQCKKRIDASKLWPYFSVGEIWSVNLGQNVSSETQGKGSDFLRPVLVLKKLYVDGLLVVPLSTKERRGDYFFSFSDSRGIKQYALLAQIRYLDARRLRYKKSKIGTKDFSQLVYQLIELIKK